VRINRRNTVLLFWHAESRWFDPAACSLSIFANHTEDNIL